MDTGFIDLDILLTRIRNTRSKVYFLDAVKAYKAGALRASLTSAWVALVFDLIEKYRELSALDDAAATEFIRLWDTAIRANDDKKLLKLEASIIGDATNKTQVINHIVGIHLQRLREDRNLCAHPAFSAEAKLFEPSPELVRLHLVNAVDFVLSQEPLQGKAIFDRFDVDVQSAGFPRAYAQILDYVEQRYLERVRPQSIRNFGTVLVKSLLKGVPPKWESQRSKIISSLVAVRERATQAWPDIYSTIIRLIDNLEPENRPRAIAFLAAFPDFWPLLRQSTQTALQETVDNANPAALTDYRILAGVSLAQFRPSLLNVIASLDCKQLGEAIAAQARTEFWPHALGFYESSYSFRGSETNFRELISPFAGRLNTQQHDQLFDAVIKNRQNWDAGDTNSLLLDMLRNATPLERPSHEARNRFYQHICRMDYLLDLYEDLLAFLQDDGWVAPSIQQDDDEQPESVKSLTREPKDYFFGMVLLVALNIVSMLSI